MKDNPVVARMAAAGAVAIAIAGVVVILLLQGGGYQVKARFINASQIVKGNLVQVAGTEVGKVEDIKLTDDGQAELTLSIEDEQKPLRHGTIATIRQASLSGIANRYVDLNIPGADGAEIPDGGTIRTSNTQAAVDLDELLNVFDDATREDLREDLKGFASMYAGREEQANEAFRYLNPVLSSSSRLFSELNRNEDLFERFITETSSLVGDLSERREDLGGLVSNLARTSTALAAQKSGLADSINRLPGFMRSANTTFVNLRATLDDLDPLVEAAKPVVRDKLRPLFAELRPFARDAAPTVRDLSRTIRRPGKDNDLVELLRAQPAVDRVANEKVQANGAEREGAFPASTRALRTATPEMAYARPYAVDLTGWFDDFSESGAYDALGSFSRAGLAFSAFTFTPALQILPVPPELRDEVLAAGAELFRNNRCPGSMERPAPDGTNPFKPNEDFNCDPAQVPVGP